MKRLERIHLLSRADALQPVRHLLRELISKYAFNKKSINNIIIAINEACMNVIQHAYHNQEGDEIIIELYKKDESLLVRILDFAEIADLTLIKSRDLNDVRPGGLGVHLIKQLMDKVEYKNMQDDSVNVLEMQIRFDVEDA